MARRIASSTLNASSIDIMNVIRENASYEYQQSVPKVTQAVDIPKVGEVIYGTPAFANQFINALVNRIAIVRAKSATFNNPYSVLKKGYLEFGETIEDIFVNIAKVVDYDPEKAPVREFQRTLPNVKSAFHVMNWRVMYPVTIQDNDLKMAFLSLDGVTDLIAKIVDSVYTAAEYDEFLLFKYLLIKAVANNRIKRIHGNNTLSDLAVQFRGLSNILPFMSSEYNHAGVKNTTPKDRQVIFMDATFNAQFDVNVLASAFNMDKADFMGRLFLIDNWTTFDNTRFDVIRANSDGLEEVTEDELNVMSNIKAIIMDEEWFQVYDNNNKFTEDYISAGLYWNYFYHTWKTISSSPFANAVAITSSPIEIVESIRFSVSIVDKQVDSDGIISMVVALEPVIPNKDYGYKFIQTKDATEKGIAVQPYGVIIMNKDSSTDGTSLIVEVNELPLTADKPITTNITTGDIINFTYQLPAPIG